MKTIYSVILLQLCLFFLNSSNGLYAQCYTQKNVSGLPSFKWMLDGNKSDYASYETNQYFVFNSNWSYGQCGGANKRHTGWDIHKKNLTAIAGTKVYAAFNGTVKVVYDAGTGWANGITIEHTDNNAQKFTTTYLHVNPANGISANTPVTTGQLIATVADLAQNDHMHFSVRRAAYSNVANRGALPKDLINNVCSCNSDPVFPEYFVNPGTVTYYDAVSGTPTPVIITPTSSNTAIPVQFDWSTISGAEYRVQVSDSPNGWTATDGLTSSTQCTGYAHANKNTGGTSSFQWQYIDIGVCKVPEAGRTYYWTVKAWHPSTGNSSYSPLQSFTTSCLSPSTAQISASNITSSAARLNCVADAPSEYDWQYRKLGAGTWIDVSSTAANYKNISGLLSNTKYEFRVALKCSGVWGNWTLSKVFITASGFAPDNSPAESFVGSNGLKKISISPNPSSGRIFISNITDEGNIEIFDLKGQLQLTKKILKGRKNIELDLSQLNNGAYYLKYKDKNSSQTHKIQIMK